MKPESFEGKPQDEVSVDSPTDTSEDASIGEAHHSNASLFNSRLVESLREKEEAPVYRKPSVSISSVHSSDSHSSKVSRSKERRASQDELSAEQALKSIQSPFTQAPIPHIASSSDPELENE